MKKDDPPASELSSHFAFGENWKDFSTTIDEAKVNSAVENLSRLLGGKSLENLTFLDIGCGSGIHSLAALRLGARKVVALDIDPVSVETCKGVLAKWDLSGEWECRVASVFDIPTERRQSFDVVYSWGVLHHTGCMWRAIKAAASMARAEGGTFALALYKKTPMCLLWKKEKRIYSKLPRALQYPVLSFYTAVNLSRLLLRGTSPLSHIRDYKRKRGMSFWHDAHDWLGGYPYESASPAEVRQFLGSLNFHLVRDFIPDDSFGLTGASCAEYVFGRGSSPTRE